MSAAHAIELVAASKWYGNVVGLNGVDLAIDSGLHGLLGPNGSGKSTLMKLVTGQLRPSLGRVLVHGRSVGESVRARAAIGYAAEQDHFYEEATGRAFVYAMARLSGLARADARRRAEAALEEVGMRSAAGKKMRGCSKGMRQRIKIAQALVHDPDLLVLDEPLSGIDPTGRGHLIDLFRRLRDRGKTLLVSSHILEELESLTERLILMAWGRVLASGTVREIRGLLREHPLTIRLVCAPAREVARHLVGAECVVGVALEETVLGSESAAALIVKVSNADSFFALLPAVVAQHAVEVHSLEPLDVSAAAVFDYLLGRAPSRGF